MRRKVCREEYVSKRVHGKPTTSVGTGLTEGTSLSMIAPIFGHANKAKLKKPIIKSKFEKAQSNEGKRISCFQFLRGASDYVRGKRSTKAHELSSWIVLPGTRKTTLPKEPDKLSFSWDFFFTFFRLPCQTPQAFLQPRSAASNTFKINPFWRRHLAQRNLSYQEAR